MIDNLIDSLYIARLKNKHLITTINILKNTDIVFHLMSQSRFTIDYLTDWLKIPEENRMELFYSIFEKKSKNVVGFCYLRSNAHKGRYGELFISFKRNVLYRDQYINESVLLMLDIAFKKNNLLSVCMNIISKYKETLHSLINIGFTELEPRERIRLDGNLLDVINLKINQEDYLLSK